MNNKKTLYGVVVVFILLVVGAFFLWQKTAREALIKANPPVERPLLLQKNVEHDLERKSAIDAYKQKILNRAKLQVPLTPEEKINFEIILLKGEHLSSGDTQLASQEVLQFTEEELRLISGAVHYQK